MLCFWELLGPWVNSKREMRISKLTSHRGKFSEIECRKLKVVDWDGEARVILTTDFGDAYTTEYKHGERVIVYGGASSSQVILRSMETGADLGRVILSTSGDGGRITLGHGKDSNSQVWLGFNEHGGFVSATGKDGASGVWHGVGEHGGRGEVSICNSQAWFGVYEQDGRVVVRDIFGNLKPLN